MGYFRRKYLTFEGDRRRKNENFCSGASGEGIRADGGRPGRRNGGGVVAAVLVVVMVRIKSKTNCAPCLLVLFYVAANLFCTVGSFAPWPELAGMPEAGRLEGSQAGGLAGVYPPLHLYSRNDKSVWFAEIFFRFSGRLG